MLPTCKNGGQFLLELVCHPPSEVMNLTAYDILNTENKLTHTLKGASLRLLLEQNDYNLHRIARRFRIDQNKLTLYNNMVSSARQQSAATNGSYNRVNSSLKKTRDSNFGLYSRA